MTSSERTVTRPETPSTIRTICGATRRGGMKSMTRIVPSGVSHSVSSTSESSRYLRLGSAGVFGAPSQRPGSPPPRRRAERGEAGVGVESRETAPVHRPAAVNECRRLHIGEERIIFDHSRRAHSASPERRLLAQTNLLRAWLAVGQPFAVDPHRITGPACWAVFAEWTTATT